MLRLKILSKTLFFQGDSLQKFLQPISIECIFGRSDPETVHEGRKRTTGAPLRVIISPSILEGFVNSIFQGWSGVGTELAHRKVG